MPLVRIDLNKTASAERARVVSEAVYKAMVEVASVPLHDKFQVITRHETEEIIYPAEGYLGLTYSPDRRSIDRCQTALLPHDRRRNPRKAGCPQRGHLHYAGRQRPRGLVVRQWQHAIRAEAVDAASPIQQVIPAHLGHTQ